MDDVLTLLLVGDSSHPEFAAAVGQMRAMGRVIEVADLADTIAWCDGAESLPALVVIAAAWPGQWSGDAVERFRRRLPLTPIVALLGAWCEGETRSGAPWPGVVRVCWHQWPQRFPQELARLKSGECGSWNLPVTASADEHLLWQIEAASRARRGLVAVVADRREMAEWLVAACRQHGWATVWNAAVWNMAWRSVETLGADAVLWDADLTEPDVFDDLQQIKSVFCGAPVVALTDFPRVDDQRRLMAAGVAAVLSKPLLVRDLDWQLARLAHGTERQPDARRRMGGTGLEPVTSTV